MRKILSCLCLVCLLAVIPVSAKETKREDVGWRSVYYQYILEAWRRWPFGDFRMGLYDLNEDGIPELFSGGSWGSDEELNLTNGVYTAKDGQIRKFSWKEQEWESSQRYYTYSVEEYFDHDGYTDFYSKLFYVDYYEFDTCTHQQFYYGDEQEMRAAIDSLAEQFGVVGGRDVTYGIVPYINLYGGAKKGESHYAVSVKDEDHLRACVYACFDELLAVLEAETVHSYNTINPERIWQELLEERAQQARIRVLTICMAGFGLLTVLSGMLTIVLRKRHHSNK